MNKYTTTSTLVINEGRFNNSIIKIYNNGEYIGEYIRGYEDKDCDSFCHFSLNGKDYAIYSSNYTCSKIMTLPDCKDIVDGIFDKVDYCPIEYYVPRYVETDRGNIFDFNADDDEYYNTNEKSENIFYRPYIFISGQYWASSPIILKIIDVSKIEDGIVIPILDKVDEIELCYGLTLKQSIDTSDFECSVIIATPKHFNIKA